VTVKKIEIDPKIIPRSYRDYLKKMVEMDEFFEIDDEIDWNLEMGAICRRALETGAPSPIFNKVKGCPDGFRAAEVGYQKSGTPGRDWARVAVQLGLPPETGLMEIMHAYNEVMESGTVHPPKIVENKDSPCKENIWTGDDIDITKFPAPIAHGGDGGRYIQTVGLNILRTPDGKWTNWSTSRGMIANAPANSKNTMTISMSPWAHGGMIHGMWKKESKDCPIAIAFGAQPAVNINIGTRQDDYVDEYDASSKLLDEPIELVKCETNDLLVPADAEIILEGVLSKDKALPEGPFGEYPGYQFAEHRHLMMPRIDITGVTFRNDPILPVGLPGVGPDSTQVSISLFSSADVLAYLKREGFPVIEALITFESGMCWFVIKTKNDRHEITGWRLKEYMDKLANALWGTHYGHTATKVLVVGEDIDPMDPVAVSWAFATRNHPTQGCFYFPELKSVGIGPESYHSMADFNALLMDHDDLPKGNSLVIYSCIGLEEHVGQPKPVQLTFERNFPDFIREKVLANWKKWGLPELNDPNRNPTWKYFETTGVGETGRRTR
jgi:4-hydroxy-3-polyprenylbenzoate decarboxylase